MMDQDQLNIVFDFGGVLFDWSPYYLYSEYFDGDREAINRFLEEIGFWEWNLQQDMGRPWVEAVADLSEQFPQHGDLIHAFYREWDKTLAGPIDPVVTILNRLHEMGYPLFALTNWSAEKFNQVRLHYDFLDCFESIVVSGEVKLAKPDPEIFYHLLDVIGQEAERCLLIDDSYPNIETARRLGFQTIHFLNSEQLKRELRQHHVQVS